MRTRLFMTAMCVLGLAILDATPASAADKFYIGSTSWDTVADWDAVSCGTSASPGVPATNDNITVCSSRTVTMTGPFTAGNVTVEDTATLNTGIYALTIPGADVLTVTGTTGTLDVSGAEGDLNLTGTGTHVIAGFLPISDSTGRVTVSSTGTLRYTGGNTQIIEGGIVLSASGATLSSATASGLLFTDTGGAGFINGAHDASEIVIAHVDDGVEFETRIDIKGSLDILADGDFLNNGLVHANRANEVLLLRVTDATNGTLDDADGAVRWKVDVADAMLRFDESPACLKGHFNVEAGTLRAGNDIPDDDVDVFTLGDLRHTGGKIIAGVDDSFVFNGGTCP